MKKLFLLFILIATTITAWGATTGLKTIADLKGSQTWSNETYNIAVDEAITLDYGKYNSDAGGQLRYYYQNNTNASKFTLIAKAGVIIRTVYFEYTVFVANTVLADSYYSGNVPSGHEFNEKTVYNINASSKTFHVGKISGNGGTLCLTKIEVTYDLASPELKFAKEEVNVCKNAADFINPLQNKGNGAVTYSSGSSSVATVASDGTITVKGVGSTTITATTDATSLYKSESKSYTIKVSSDLAPSPLATQDYTLKRSFGAVTEQMDLVHWNTAYGTPLVLNNVITVTTANAGYRRDSSNNAIRVYSSNGELKFKARDGAIIKSIKLIWSSTTGNGVLTKKANGGYSIKDVDKIVSGTTYTINANSVSYWVGSTWAACQNTSSSSISIGLSEFEIVYSDPNSVVERYSGLTSLSAADSETAFDGDNKLYKWKVRNCATSASQLINNVRGIYVKYNSSANEGYLAMNGDQEGGVKDISYEYITANQNLRYHFYIKQGNTNLDEYLHKGPAQKTYVYNYNKMLSVSSNSAISIVNPKQESPQNVYFTMSPISISPYLLFNVANHAATFNVVDGTTCDLNSALINNTGTTPVYTIESNTCGGYPEVVNGILDFGSVTKEGAIVVKATWEQVSTTLTINVTGSISDITGYHKRVLLYPNGAPDSNGYTAADEYTQGTGWYKVAIPKLYIYRPTSGTPKGTILVIPGGGYGMISYVNEGTPVAEKLVAKGWAAAVLKYRLPNGHTNIPLEDACRAMELLKDSATQWGLNPAGKFGVAGFSAGGHLASTLVTKYTSQKTRPDFGMLFYPVITLESGLTHNGSRINLLGNNPSTELVDAWTTDKQVTANTPPCLLLVSQDDATVPCLNSVRMYNALCDKNIYAEMVVVPEGGHGWGSSVFLPHRDVVDKAVYNYLDSTILNPSPAPSRHLAVSPSRRLASSSNIDIYEPSANPKGTILSLLGTDERVNYFVNDGYRVAVLHYSPSASKADSLADVEQAMQDIRQMQKEAGMECAVGCMAKGTNVPLAISIMAENAGETIRPDFGILLSPDVSKLNLTEAITTTTSPCIVIADQDDAVDVRNSTQMFMAMTNANRRECELVLTPRTSTINLAIRRFLENKAYTTATVAKRSIAAMAEQLGWADNALPGDLTFNSVVSLIYEKPLNQGRYSSGKGGLRCYQQSGYYTIQARPGATIKSIKLTYSVWDTNLKGVVIRNWGTDGYDYPADAKIESGKTYEVNANSIRLWTGSLGPKDGNNNQGTVCITDFEIVYTDSLSVTEHYTSLVTQSSTDDVYFHGDQGLYGWKIKNYQHISTDASDYVNGVWGVRLKYNGTTSEGYLAMNGNQEGGVKDISFDYHALNNTMPFHFYIKQGSTVKGEFTHAATSNANYIYNYTGQLNLTSNTAISIVMPKKESTPQTYITMGPVTITPYLLYTKKVVTLKLHEMAGKTYTNAALINNTAGVGTIGYTVSGTNAANIASIDATGAITALREGQVTVTATWGQVSTTYQLIIQDGGSGSHTVTGNVPVLAKQYDWQNGNGNNCYTDFQLDDVISVSSSTNNAKYLYNATENCLRFYQGTNNGQFTIRAKAGVIIQSIKLDYYNTGVITNVWTNSGKSVAEANQVKNGVPFTVDANSITLYVGSTNTETGKQVRITNIEVTYIVPGQLTLSEEDTDNSKIVAGTYNEIQLNRTLYADRYNSFCVPFAVAADEMETYFGEGCKLYALAGADTDDGITINFDESSDGIAAGVPYLMEVQEDVVNPVFTNRTITVTTAKNVVSGNVTFQGVYCQTLLDPDNTPVEYFLASNNVLYRPVVAENMKGLRAYFRVSASAGTPIRMAINQSHTPTELEVHNAQCTMHNGKFIKDNQLIIMREGKCYNAQGVRL